MPRKNKRIKGEKISNPMLRNVVLHFLQSHPGKPYSPRQIIKKLKIANDKPSVQKVLEQLLKSYREISLIEDRYYYGNLTQRVKNSGDRRTGGGKSLTGIVDLKRSGSAYIIVEGQAQDIFVRANDLETALHGDTVRVEITSRRSGKPSGKVVEVIQRATEQFIGVFHEFRNYGIVVPDSYRVPFDILIMPDKAGGAAHGDVVLVKVTKWTGKVNKTPQGEVLLLLGAPGSSSIAMQSILVQNGFNLLFPPEVLDEMERLPLELAAADLEGRADYREVPTFTIDPINAKDFDDALSLRRLENGDIEVGIHIADVTHFVKQGTAIDKEAYRRSTSVYLVDRVLPMLPERLSNELCSLRPNEDSLCFAAIFTFNSDFKVVKRWFGKTVIHSDRRFHYEEVQQILDSGIGDHAEDLKLLDQIARVLREEKLKNGALIFETDEVQFVLDENGVPMEVFAKVRQDAHLLIEDFMLLANREVATFIAKTRKSDNIPFVYRVHDAPDPEKLEQFAKFAEEMGFKMKIDTPKQIAKSFNALAVAAQKDEALMILEPIAIRTMAKAEYHTENIGHYGLAFQYYTHFTSPIRRYSDVLVHRILYDSLAGQAQRYQVKKLQDQCIHISNMERKAQRAERDSIKYKQAEFMQRFIGQQFEGHISGIIDRGIFVTLSATHAEGLVSFDSFEEAFQVEPSGLRAIGAESRKVFRMGDTVQVKIVEADPAKRQIEMEMVNK
jgi:ribonuclease R